MFVLVLTACTRSAGLPAPGSKEYRDLVTSFYVGLAGLQTGEDVRAKERLTQATQIAPGEPAAWANLGLLAVRQQEFDSAYEKVEKARTLAPDNSQIEALLGSIESKRGKLPEAISHLKKAIELDAKNLKALYALAQETERQATETSDGDAQKLLGKILEIQSDNLAVLLDSTRLAAKRGDAQTLKNVVAALGEKSTGWPDEAKQQLAALQQAAAGATPRAAATQSAFLKNVLARVPDYRRGLNEVKTPVEFVGDPFLKFIKLPSPRSTPAEPDMGMTFEDQMIDGVPAGEWDWIGAFYNNPDNKVSIVGKQSNYLKIIGGPSLELPNETYSNVLPKNLGPRDDFNKFNSPLQYAFAIDFNNDFKQDLILTGNRGVRFYQQVGANNYIDVTKRTKLPSRFIYDGHQNLWVFDFDLDGDLDILLGEQAIVLRNNGDGTFKVLEPFLDVGVVAGFANPDIDGDGDPDVVMLSMKHTSGDGRRFESVLHVFSNDRLGQYHKRSVPKGLNQIVSISAADIDGDGISDLLALQSNGEIVRISDKNGGKDWEVVVVAKVNPPETYPDPLGLQIEDFDNNGSLDLLVQGRQVLLSDNRGGFQPLAKKFAIPAYSIADINGDGRPDLVGLRDGWRPFVYINRGAKNYHYQILRTRAAQSTGDQRINSFGIGGEIEIRSGLLTQKQVITSPLLHFGLGENSQTDVARIVWPNGAVQAEFELKADQSILAEQRLKGSCPMLFAWDGKQMSFVKDCSPWNPALGLHVNAQVVANVEQTEEWFKIPGDSLAPRNGVYDLRVTAELWEAFYIDHYSLMVVDHPPGTEAFTDERFMMQQPKPRLYATTPPKPFAAARDDRGQDVSAVVNSLDQQYLDTFGRGQYQGVTRDHWVELELGEDAPRNKPLYLIGHGWLHPTDATINIAIGQNSNPPPQGLGLEVPDAKGNWVTAKACLGFLSGKLKTMVVELDGVFRPGAPRKLRLRTNLEIYWDKLEWAEGVASQDVKVQRLDAAGAELRYRGFSTFTQANASSPELPDYNRMKGTAPRWRDLTGYYTRYGDVRELLAQTDDRMLIMNAGDELRLTFAALPSPPAGWKRDFVMIGDGWTKDGDYNCTYAATVLPLPYHGIKDYNTASTKLEDNPAYRRYPHDWQEYHTRYVTPDYFLKALR